MRWGWVQAVGFGLLLWELEATAPFQQGPLSVWCGLRFPGADLPTLPETTLWTHCLPGAAVGLMLFLCSSQVPSRGTRSQCAVGAGPVLKLARCSLATAVLVEVSQGWRVIGEAPVPCPSF